MNASRIQLRAGSSRRAAFACALVGCALLFPGRGMAQVTPQAYEEGIIAVAAQDLPVLTSIMLVDSAGQVLLPLLQIAGHMGLTPVRQDSATLRIPRLDGGFTLLDLAAHTITAAGVTTPVAPAELVVRNDEVYVTTARLATLIEGNAVLDMATLSLTLDRIPPFPAQQQVLIDQQRAVLIARDSYNRRVEGSRVPYRPLTNAGTIDWGVSSHYLDPRKLTQFRAELGAAVWGGALALGATATAGTNANESTPHEFFGRYLRAFPDNERISQVGIGDIVTTGLFARFIRGLQVTNAPQHRSYDLGEILVRPDLPAGWQYEVLQNGQLLGFSDAVTQAPVAVPLRLGTTPVLVRMYGPGGQEVVNTLLYQTPTTLLERGRFEYAAAAGNCVAESCTRFGQIDARYGGWTRLTIGAGAEYLSDTTGSAIRPYAVSSFTTGEHFTGELEVMPDALYRASLMAFPRPASTGRITFGFSEAGYGRVSVLPDSKGRWDGEASWEERLARPIGPIRSLRTSIGGTGFTDGSIAHRRVSLAGTLGNGFAELRWEKAPGTPTAVRAQASMLVPTSLARFGIRPVATAGLGISRTGISLISIGAVAQKSSFGTLSLSADWARGTHEPRLTLSWQRSFSAMLAVTRLTSGPRGTDGGSMSMTGAIFAAPDGELDVSGLPREGYGGVYGSVFVDNDANGEFSPGDEAVPDARLIIGNTRAVANQSGIYHAWELLPYSVLRVSLDSTTIADPTWITAQSAIFARPVPNTAVRVDIPILRTREVVGRISAVEGVATAGGVSVQLAPIDGGETLTVSTFSDGEFYISRVRPGRYRLTVAQSSLNALGATSDPEGLEVTIEPSVEVLELPPLYLRPRGRV
ncbi:MAG TPA: carboxypeptidase-like regulatory domain-containing protein [Longimicrobiales bacterium]